MAEVDQAGGGERWPVVTAIGAVVTVAVVAAVVSYMHMREVAEAAGEGWRAILLPLSVDGMIVAATLNAWQARKRHEPLPVMTLVALVAGLLVSIAANVAVPFLPQLTGGWLSAVVAAWPPIALAISFEELIRMLRSGGAPAARERHDGSERAAEVEGDELRFAAAGPEFAGDLAAGNVGLPERAADVPPHAGDLAAEPEGLPEATPEELPEAPSVPPVEESGDPRESARALARQEPGQWTGAALAERFGRSPRWGRDQLAAVRREQAEPAKPQLVSVQS